MLSFRTSLGLLLAVGAIAQQPATTAIDDGRPWLENPPQSTPLHRAAAAAFLNQNAVAERALTRIIRDNPGSHDASEAHKLLCRIYVRTGRYRSLLRNFDAWAKAFPNSTDVKTEAEDVQQFRNLPDQSNGPLASATLPHSDDFWIPVAVNNQPATYLLDTGAWVSMISESDAKRYGLEIHNTPARISDSSGLGAKGRYAVARDLTVGAMHFRNVSFLVLDNPQLWETLPEGHRGVIGVPVILGLNTLHWSKAGTLEVGAPSQPGPVNLAYFENKLTVATTIANRRAFFTVDTGANTTDLNNNFAATFADLLTNAKPETIQIGGAGGVTRLEALILPELSVEIGGQTATLRPATVSRQSNPGLGGKCCVGNLGDELITSTGAFTLDFSRMSFRLR